VAVAYQHVREPAAPPSDHDTDLPPAIDAIVMKSLAKRVEDRYQSAAAMRSDIDRYLAGRPVHAVIPDDPPPTAVVPPVGGLTRQTTVTEEPYEEEHRGRSGALWVLGLLLLLLIGAAAYFLPKFFESPPDQVRVPQLINLSEKQARAEIGKAGLSVGQVTYRSDASTKKNRVLEQDPNPDLYVTPGSEVDLVVSTGKPMKDVPYVIGDPKDEAAQTLQGAGFNPILRTRESDEPKGQVLQTDPAPGDSVPEGSDVTVYFSDGPEKVPDVIGLQQDVAEQKIRDAGFEPRVVESTATTEPKGTVIDQSPEGGQSAQEGSTVTIVVSAFDEPSPSESSSTDSPTELPTAPTSSPSRVAAPGPSASPSSSATPAARLEGS
jgi:serine/threonine-protein kinase